MVLKVWLGARDDVKDGRRPFDRKSAFGERGGLKTPFDPSMPFRFPEDASLDAIVVGGRVLLCADRIGV
jgi:hypothetical protein